jgi:hypothetical protein
MPESHDTAAVRHYLDAEALGNASRYDNAGHLIGFAAECAIKYAFAIAEPADASPRLHLPDLANAVLKQIKSRNPREIALRNLLMSTKGGFFHDWRISARYEANGLVNPDTYRRWRTLAERALGAAGLRR